MPDDFATVWKYPLQLTDDQQLEMPEGAELLHVGLDPEGAPCLWAACTPNAEKVARSIRIAATGQLLRATPLKMAARFVGTFQTGPFVWHVFDHGEPRLDPPEGGRSDG